MVVILSILQILAILSAFAFSRFDGPRSLRSENPKQFHNPVRRSRDTVSPPTTLGFGRGV